MWWYTSIIPALKRQRQEDCKPGLHSETLSQKERKQKGGREGRRKETIFKYTQNTIPPSTV
jgi:hypothetical protein